MAELRYIFIDVLTCFSQLGSQNVDQTAHKVWLMSGTLVKLTRNICLYCLRVSNVRAVSTVIWRKRKTAAKQFQKSIILLMKPSWVDEFLLEFLVKSFYDGSVELIKLNSI